MRAVIIVVAVLAVLALGVGYTVAQDQPATPAVYTINCGSPVASPATRAPATPATGTSLLTDPTVDAAQNAENNAAEMTTGPQATPGVFTCASPGATPN